MVSKLNARFAKSAFVAICILFASASWAGPEEGLFKAATIIYSSSENQSPELKKLSYESIKKILDQIVADYPSSDLAVRIILQDTIDGLDVAVVDAALGGATETVAQPQQNDGVRNEEEPPLGDFDGLPQTSKTLEQSNQTLETSLNSEIVDGTIDNQTSEMTESDLELTRDMRREIQRRLTLIGHDTKGVDGSLGKNSRKAIMEWQVEYKLPPTGYLNDSQLSALKLASAEEYAAWEKDEASKPKKKKRRVRLCKRGVLGILYDCRYVWR
jgi:hypothetical protein